MIQKNVSLWTLASLALESFPRNWNNDFARNFVVGHQFPENGLSPDKTTVVGGICSIFTGDSESIRKKEVNFKNENDFLDWMSSWYPRKDQIHSTVGAPPNSVRQIYYVVEDSIFARRIARQTNLNPLALCGILKHVHKNFGEEKIKNYLRRSGYQGEITPIYTSEIEKEHLLCLNIWERMLGKRFDSKNKDYALVALMYSGLWADCLGINGPMVIYEPEDHMSFPLNTSSIIIDWYNKNPYGQNGVNKNVGIIGYEQYHIDNNPTRNLKHYEVN